MTLHCIYKVLPSSGYMKARCFFCSGGVGREFLFLPQANGIQKTCLLFPRRLPLPIYMKVHMYLCSYPQKQKPGGRLLCPLLVLFLMASLFLPWPCHAAGEVRSLNGGLRQAKVKAPGPQQGPVNQEQPLVIAGHGTFCLIPEKHTTTRELQAKLDAVKKRYQEQGGIQGVAAALTQPEQVAWHALMASVPRMPASMQLMVINKFFNERPWREDATVYRVNDYWATPVEFIRNGGDCEEYALAKYLLLLDLGWPETALWLVVGETTNKPQREWHVVVAAQVDNAVLYLDNTVFPQDLLVTEDMLLQRFAPYLAFVNNVVFSYYKIKNFVKK